MAVADPDGPPPTIATSTSSAISVTVVDEHERVAIRRSRPVARDRSKTGLTREIDELVGRVRAADGQRSVVARVLVPCRQPCQQPRAGEPEPAALQVVDDDPDARNA